jgi:hypothetical protein
MHRLLGALLVVCCSLAGCETPSDSTGQTPSNSADDLKAIVAERVDADDTGGIFALHGLTEAEMKDSFGPADKSRDFVMGDCCHEFEIELYNTYPPDEPEHADVQIRERSWHIGDHILTAWFHQEDDEWVVLNTHLWHKHTEF